MNSRISYFCLTAILTLFTNCTKEKEIKYDYPRVVTGQVIDVHAAGATFNGTFLDAGTDEIIDHGFVFGMRDILTIQSNQYISLGKSTGKGSFTATANYDLMTGFTYYVSAYARNKDKIFYAEAVRFVFLENILPKVSKNDYSNL
jgi:hypothetical protein